jgi:FAD/FMN-containing dehydrogenase
MYQSSDPRYVSLRQGAVWNGVVPDRFPNAIARPADRAEVARLVAEAKHHGQRIAVKSGGHSWRGSCLRDGGLLLDFGDLHRVEVDHERTLAMVEPGATHKVLADALVPHGVGFAIGHCPTVGLGGYLLAGGYGWNPRIWGPACWSVAGIDVVDVDGDELHVSDEQHPDLYWAARGGGSGFPAVATRFHLRLEPLPKIVSIRRDYTLSDLSALLPWSASVEEMPRGTEISLIAHRPVEKGQRVEPRATVQASGFASDGDHAMDLARAAADGALEMGNSLSERAYPDVLLNDLEGEGAWVEGLRYCVDMCWVDAGYDEVAKICELAIENAPSEKSRIVLAWGFAPPNGPDVAQTANGTLTVNLYAIWEDPAEDDGNEAWIGWIMAELEPMISGFYVGEADLSVAPDRPRRCYPPAKWARLNEIRNRWDPERRKYAYLSED